MKNRYTLFTILFITLATLANISKAQVTLVPGPSSPATPPPTSATGINKVLCNGTPISISVPADANVSSYKWYKLDASGQPSANPIALTNGPSSTYQETPTTPGYYDYKVIAVNINSCESPLSAVYRILVLPPLSVQITTPNAGTVCSGVTDPTAVLTAVPNPESNGYNLHYQWTKGGVAIPGAADQNTYTVPQETVNTSTQETYGVNVTYDLNTTCPATATKTITVIPLPTAPVITAN